MPVYKNGSKVKSLYHNGNKIKKAFYFGNLCYEIKDTPTSVGVSTTGNNIIIHTTRVIWPKKTTTRFTPDGDLTGETTDLGPTPLGKEIVIPMAKDSYSTYDFDEETGAYGYIGYSPSLYIENSEYPGGYMNVYKGSGEEFATFERGSSSWKYLGTLDGLFTWGSAYAVKEGNDFELVRLGGISTAKISPLGTWDIRIQSLKVDLPPSYSSNQWYRCRLVSLFIRENVSGNIIAVNPINKDMERTYYGSTGSYTIDLSYCTFNSVPLDKEGTTYSIYARFENGESYNNANSTNLAIKAESPGAQARPRLVTIIEHYDEDMVLEVDKQIYEDIQEQEDGSEEVTGYQEITQISLTPASEYDPLSSTTGIANIKVGEESNVYDIVEFA